MSPERIVLGGGLMQNLSLFPRIRARVTAMLNGYINVPTITDADAMASYIVPPVAGGEAGLMGALQLGLMARNAAGGGGAFAQAMAAKRQLLAGVNPCMLACVAAAAGALAMHLARR